MLCKNNLRQNPLRAVAYVQPAFRIPVGVIQLAPRHFFGPDQVDPGCQIPMVGFIAFDSYTYAKIRSKITKPVRLVRAYHSEILQFLGS